jgi:hypothetical protein
MSKTIIITENSFNKLLESSISFNKKIKNIKNEVREYIKRGKTVKRIDNGKYYKIYPDRNITQITGNEMVLASLIIDQYGNIDNSISLQPLALFKEI